MPAPFQILVLNINPTTRTPITVPFDCTSLAIENRDLSNPVLMRTNASDSSTQDPLGGSKKCKQFP